MEEEEFISYCSYLQHFDNSSSNIEHLFNNTNDILNIEKMNLTQSYFDSNRFQRFIDFEINNQINFCENYIFRNNSKMYLIKYFYPIIFCLGILANFVSFILMIKVHKKKVYKIFPLTLAILCLSDCFILIFDCLREYLDIHDIFVMSNSVYSCKITFYVCYLFNSFSSSLYILICKMRCEAVRDPIKYKQEFSKENQKRILLIFFTCFAINIPFFFYSILQKSYGQIKPDGERIVLKIKCQIHQDYYSQLMIFDAVFFYILPFILILFFSILTFIRLLKKYQFQECISQTGLKKSESKYKTCQSLSSLIHADSVRKSVSSIKTSKRTNSSFKIFLSLMALPVFYLITTTPLILTFFLQFYNNYFQKATYYHTAPYYAKMPVYINNSLNVLVFILAGKNLRKELFKIFKSSKLEKQLSLRMTSLNTK